MLISGFITLLVMTASASPLLEKGVEREVEDQERNLGDVENRLLTEDDRDLVAAAKGINYKSAGDYTLISVPWNTGTSLRFNDSAASTISTLGNAALLVGGLYLLSGFPTAAISRADPFGISRRFGAPALPGPPPPRHHRINHKKGQTSSNHKKGQTSSRRQEDGEEKRRKPKQPRKRPSQPRRRPQPVAEERQLRPFRLPSLAASPPLNFRLPSLPTLRMPQLPRLRRPTLPQITNPFRRPTPTFSRPAPRPSPQSSRPASQSSRPAPPVQSNNAPAQPSVTVQQTPAPQAPSFRPVITPSEPVPSNPPSLPALTVPSSPSSPLIEQSFSRPAPSPVSPPASIQNFGEGVFDNDPFQEFQSADFGSDASFRDLISQQFGNSFDIERLPKQ